MNADAASKLPVAAAPARVADARSDEQLMSDYKAGDASAFRVLVEVDDLNTTLNQGATYFAEAQYVAPSEYTWCQAHSTAHVNRCPPIPWPINAGSRPK